MITRNSVTPFERLYALQRDAYVPPMDVVETNDEVLVHLEVPGINRKDLEIRTEGNTMFISGEKKLPREARFERSFSLPRTVKTADIRARYTDGVLTIVLPKSEEAKPRRIEIEDGSSERSIS